MAAVAVPYEPESEEWPNDIIQWPDPYHHWIKVTLPESYLKILEPDLNELGLPEKEFYTTVELCRLLDLTPDTFRYRHRSGIYHEAENRSGDKRQFSFNEVAEIVRITRTILFPKYHPMRVLICAK